MTTQIENMRSRLNPTWPAHVRGVSERALTVLEEIGKHKTTSTSRDDLRSNAAKNAAPMLARAMRDLDQGRRQIKADRAALKERAFKFDTPRAAQMAAEVRAHIRGLSQGDVASLLVGPKADKAAVLAVMEAPGFLTGVSDALRGHAETDFLDKHHAAELKALATTEEALSHADASIKLASGDMQRALEFDSHSFNNWFEKAKPSPELVADEVAAQRQKADADREAAVDRRLAELMVRSA